MDHCVHVKKTDSIVSDRCYEMQYKNDSRKWLLRDGLTPNVTEKVSTMKGSFPYQKPDSPIMGRRTKIIREQLLREAEREVLAELNQPPEVEDYLSTYDDTYCPKIPGFVPTSERKRDPELYEKYPLYSSAAMSYWQFNIDKNAGSTTLTPGLTKTLDKCHPFRKNSNFSTPISEVTVDVQYL